jgi:hypothetical protein
MATAAEMTRAADRRVRILDRIRTGLETEWAAPTVLELAEAEHVTRRAIDADLTILEREGLIVQDTTTRPRRIRLAGHRLVIVEDVVDAEIVCGATLVFNKGRDNAECDLPDGHDGTHVHHDHNGTALTAWRDEDTTPKETDQP